jgi:hypothetical protein
MTNEALVDIMRNLKIEWIILKDEKKAKIDRRKSCKNIIELSQKAFELDPKFEVIDMNNTVYAEFVPKGYVKDSNVRWMGDVHINECEVAVGKAHDVLDILEGLAVMRTRGRLPNEPEDSQKFGMITSAYTDKYIALYTHFSN